MSGTYQVDNGGDVYTVVDSATTYYWAVITGTVTDEIFPTMNVPGLTLEVVGRADLGSKALPNGAYAITGYPAFSFPPTSLPATVSYTLSAPGYRDTALLSTTINPNPVYPVPGQSAAMRLLPVRVQGRVVDGTTLLPVGGVTILSIDNPFGPPPSAHTTALRAPLYFAHASATGVQAVTIGPGTALALQRSVTGGDQVLSLLSSAGLAAGSIIQLSNASGVWLEYAIVASLGPGSNQVSLTAPVNYSYPMSIAVSVSSVTATPTGAVDSLSFDANIGDGVLLTSQLFSQAVVIEDSNPALKEIHAVGALTGTDGYYGLDGIGRVQEIFLQPNAGSPRPVVDWFIEYDLPVNIVNFQV